MVVSTHTLRACAVMLAVALAAMGCFMTDGVNSPTPMPTVVATPKPTPTAVAVPKPTPIAVNVPVWYPFAAVPPDVNNPPECGRLCQPDFWESVDIGAVETELQRGADIKGALGLALWHNAPVAVIELMLQRGADPNAIGYIAVITRVLNQRPEDEWWSPRTPLQLAIEWKRPPAIVQLLLEYGADPNPPTDYDRDDESPLYYAARLWYDGARAVIELLLEHGANINAKSYHGLTPLHLAVYQADHTLIELLLNHGADIHARTNTDSYGLGGRFTTPLHIAAESNPKSRSIATLLDHGADINAKADGGETPLHMASSYNHLGIVALLLERGADVNAEAVRGTALHWAIAHNRDPAIIPLLLDHGADVNAEKDHGVTPLHMAAGHSNVDLVALLLDRGADVNAKSKGTSWTTSLNFSSPLHWTLSYSSSSLEVVKLLVGKGADLNAEDQDGRTPCQIAKEYDKPPDIRQLVCR